MTSSSQPSQPPPPKPIRWWPALLIAAASIGVLVWIQSRDDTPFQHRLQLAELEYVVSSKAKAMTLAENYVG